MDVAFLLASKVLPRQYSTTTVIISRELGMEAITRRTLLGVATAALPMSLLQSASGQAQAGRLVTIDAQPYPISVDINRTAVVVVDMQNDFGAKGGMFDLAGIDISGIQKAILPTQNAVSAARRARIPIVFLKMAFQPDLSDLGTADSVNRVRHLQVMHVGRPVQAPDGRPSRILIRDTWNSDVVPELAPQGADQVIYKSRFSGFYRTDLDERLRSMNVKHLIVTGCTTSVCVESTVRDAMFRDYQCVLLRDCMSEPIGHEFPRTNHDASLLTVQRLFGWIADSEAFLKAIS